MQKKLVFPFKRFYDDLDGHGTDEEIFSVLSIARK
jgi:hypothetical protein